MEKLPESRLFSLLRLEEEAINRRLEEAGLGVPSAKNPNPPPPRAIANIIAYSPSNDSFYERLSGSPLANENVPINGVEDEGIDLWRELVEYFSAEISSVAESVTHAAEQSALPFDYLGVEIRQAVVSRLEELGRDPNKALSGMDLRAGADLLARLMPIPYAEVAAEIPLELGAVFTGNAPNARQHISFDGLVAGQEAKQGKSEDLYRILDLLKFSPWFWPEIDCAKLIETFLHSKPRGSRWASVLGVCGGKRSTPLVKLSILASKPHALFGGLLVAFHEGDEQLEDTVRSTLPVAAESISGQVQAFRMVTLARRRSEFPPARVLRHTTQELYGGVEGAATRDGGRFEASHKGQVVGWVPRFLQGVAWTIPEAMISATREKASLELDLILEGPRLASRAALRGAIETGIQELGARSMALKANDGTADLAASLIAADLVARWLTTNGPDFPVGKGLEIPLRENVDGSLGDLVRDRVQGDRGVWRKLRYQFADFGEVDLVFGKASNASFVNRLRSEECKRWFRGVGLTVIPVSTVGVWIARDGSEDDMHSLEIETGSIPAAEQILPAPQGSDTK